MSLLQIGLQAFPEEAGKAPGLDIGDVLPYIYTALLAAAAVFFVLLALYLVRFILRRRAREKKGFKKRILLVTVPKESAEKKGEMEREKSLQEIQEDIAVAESLFAAIGGLKADRSLGAWFTGREDDFSFEVVAHEGLVSFYVAVPERLEQYITQQIHALYPHAQIEPVEDYNIFSPQGVIAGAYLTAKRHHLFPIKSYRKTEADPLNVLTNSLAKVPKGSGAAVQVLVRSARGEWRSKGAKVAALMQEGKKVEEAVAALGALAGIFGGGKKKKEGEATPPPRTLSPGEQEMQKSIQDKAGKAGLDINIRVVVSAPDASSAKLLLDNIANTFSQFNLYEFGNSFIRIIPTAASRLIREFIYRVFDERRGSVFSSEELAGIYHFPLPTTETPNIRWLTARKAPPPQNMPLEGVALGKVEYRGEESLVRIKRPDRRRHIYIIGKSGVGKSVLIENMALQDIKNGDGVCVVDPHGDLIEKILEQMPRERIDDVVYFDPSDYERPVGLNMLEVDKEEQKDFAVQEMIAIFYKLFPPEMIGPMFEHNMRNVMLTLMADIKETGTIAEIPRMFSDTDFQKFWVSKVKDPVVRAFWEKEMAKTSDFHKSEMLGYLISKVGRFVENDMMRNIIGQRRSSFNLRKIMDEKKVLLVNLAKGRTGEVNANLLGLIIVSKLQMAALGRADLPEAERHDFFLYIDEFQNFITDSIATILSEARKYRLCLNIAHQYMGQLAPGGDTKIKDAVIGNVGTMITFRIGIDDAEQLEKEFAPTFSAYDLINIEQYTAYVKLLIDNTAAKPFNMKTLAPQKGDPQLAAAIKQLSRLKFGRDRALVEAEIMERTALGAAAPRQTQTERTL
ncbi:ATP-binding protein [Patescibacteria group bacterium]|nr:MAG: ATP-binding protein [Patescibacteria group bacterium]